MTETDRIKKRIAGLESENKKLKHDLVNGKFGKALDKAQANLTKIDELRRKLDLTKDETFLF
jgi:ribosomal protein L29